MTHTVVIINGKAPSGGAGGVSDADLLAVVSNFFTKGVVGANNYKVEQQTTPNMTVKVNAGKAYIPNPAATILYPTELTPAENVTIAANNAGNPRIDAIVIKLDLGATPNNYASNMLSLVAVQGTAAASPSAPSDSDIQTAVGASNPWYRLADVTVANGATSITTAGIADKRSTASIAVAASAPGVHLTKSAVQSIPNTTWTPITWNQETYDTDAMHDPAVNTSRITIKTEGVYSFHANGEWAGNLTGERIIAFMVNGVQREVQQFGHAPADGRAPLSVSMQRKLAVNDYVEVYAYQSSGGALNFNHDAAPEGKAMFSAQWVGKGA